MRLLIPLLTLLLCSCWSPEKVVRETKHGDYVLISYCWHDLWGPCPKTHDESRLYGPDGDLVVRRMHGLSDSPDGRWSVGQSGESDYWLFLIDHRKHTLVKLKGHENLFASGPWSPIGSRLLCHENGGREEKYGPVILDLDPDPPQFTTVFLRPWGHSEEFICWAPDGRSIAYIDRGRQDVNYDLVQYQVLPAPAELQRLPLEKVDRYWLKYQIAWKDGRAIAVPRP